MRILPLTGSARGLSSVLLCSLSVTLSSFALGATNPILVAAASDLAPLTSELNDIYLKTYGSRLRWVPGSSGLLATQIRNGAPFDVYLAADLNFARNLEASGHLVKGSVTIYATGRLALFTKQTQFHSLESLTGKDVKHIAIANPVHAPYGAAARELLRKHGLWDRLQPKLVYGENIRQALQIAESGNAEAALVAWSLVIGKGGILLPSADHPPIRQAGGIVAGSNRQNQARQVLDLLRSPEGQQLLRRFGFDPP